MSKFSLSFVKYPDVKSTTLIQSTGNGYYSVGTVKHKDPATQEELARLFTTAPEILEALKDAVMLCGCSVKERLSGHASECRAPYWAELIDKAEGK